MKTKNLLFCAPRMLSIFFICFIAVFSLDSIKTGMSAMEIITALIFSNIPSLILAALLAVSWKFEIVGAIGYFAMGAYYVFLVSFQVLNSQINLFAAFIRCMIIALPLIIIGVLFLINWKIKLIEKRKA